ncbi:cytochrome c oxidase assembly protein [Caulobacter sp. S45]|uniref:cytochrome c oxidase assembly protein n=1 Tax=Caulobacter sp. S45 TaxID=1641861 RepID=UPI00131E0F0F|nr:cytochrome c oxidase assembly protein [Caulobacter sp. S45]
MSPAEPPRSPRRKGHGLIAGICGVAVVGMVGMAYAAVPFYRAFCQATGFDGTARRVERAPKLVIDRKITVRFDANVRGLPWKFTADQAAQTIKLGAAGMAFFTVKNTGDKPLTGRAAYNVLPESAGPYFLKTQCFCFSDQTIQPGQTERFPVIYYVEPKFATDVNTRTFQEVTLSYTFFPAPDVKPAKAG